MYVCVHATCVSSVLQRLGEGARSPGTEIKMVLRYPVGTENWPFARAMTAPNCRINFPVLCASSAKTQLQF